MTKETDLEEFVAQKRHPLSLVIYDITDNKRRLRMAKCLEKYGLRVQRSAFEAILDKKRRERMENEASKLINEEEDSLRIYVLQAPFEVKTWGRGDTHMEDTIII